MSCVLHLAPHPDDELLGAPATLLALRDAGHRVVNLACGLGSPDQHARRAAELREALARAELESRVAEPPVAMSSSQGDDLEAARGRLVEIVAAALEELEPAIVLSPSPHDRHPAHEVVARAAEQALREAGRPVRWWMWALWSALPLPTIGTTFGSDRLAQILSALEAHDGELARADYRSVVRGRSKMYAALGAELLFGFGSGTPSAEHVELLTEAVLDDGRWLLGTPRWLDTDELAVEPSAVDLGPWLRTVSITDAYGPPGAQAEGVRA